MLLLNSLNSVPKIIAFKLTPMHAPVFCKICWIQGISELMKGRLHLGKSLLWLCNYMSWARWCDYRHSELNIRHSSCSFEMLTVTCFTAVKHTPVMAIVSFPCNCTRDKEPITYIRCDSQSDTQSCAQHFNTKLHREYQVTFLVEKGNVWATNVF